MAARKELANTANKPATVASPERCICAAMQTVEGQIVTALRHNNCLALIASCGLTRVKHHDAQGFITSLGRFVTRRDGMLLQKAAGILSVAEGGYRGDELYSEDLYWVLGFSNLGEVSREWAMIGARMTRCGICRRDMGIEGVGRYRVCFNCWKMLGEPVDDRELKEALERRPNLLDEIWKRDRGGMY